MTRTLSRINDFFPGTLFDELVFPEWNRVQYPAMDTIEKEDHYLIQMDLPGVKQDDIDITFREGILTVSGQTTTEQETHNGLYRYRERKQGNFSRSIRFNKDVNTEEIAANLTDGVLSVYVPKSAASQPKRIPIQYKALE